MVNLLVIFTILSSLNFVFAESELSKTHQELKSNSLTLDLKKTEQGKQELKIINFQRQELRKQFEDFKKEKIKNKNLFISGPGTGGGGHFVVAEFVVTVDYALHLIDTSVQENAKKYQIAKKQFEKIKNGLHIAVAEEVFVVEGVLRPIHLSFEKDFVLINESLWSQMTEQEKERQILIFLNDLVVTGDLPEVNIQVD